MDVLFNQGLEDDIQLGKVLCCEVIVIRKSLGLLAKGTRGLVDVFVLDQNRKMLGRAVFAAFVFTIRQCYDLQRAIKKH